MIEKTCNGLKWLEFELFADSPLKHATFTRHGGCSQGPLAGLNISKRVGDSVANVDANLKLIKETLNIEAIASPRCTHGNVIAEVTAPVTGDAAPFCDALITQTPSLVLMITHADCQTAIFYDPIQHAIANVHSGWRGSVGNIYAATVEAMQKRYRSNPADLLVAIGPSLGPQHAQFVNYKSELPEPFWQFQVMPYYFDFWALSTWQLKEAGVLPHHIQIARIDTHSNPDYFSYRCDRLCGRQPTLCCLLPKK